MVKQTLKKQVTIVSTSDEGWHTAEIVRALKKRGITYAVTDFDTSRSLGLQMKELGQLTLWRASSLGVGTQRASVVNYLDKTIMVNEAVFRQPSVVEKYYQQQRIAATAAVSKYAIPTFIAKSRASLEKIIKRGDLTFPIIAKPNRGSRGVGIHLLESMSDVEKLEKPLREYALQRFMRNDGDWRVIVMGGRPLGAMKRVAQGGSYLNNVSRGAHAFDETDGSIRAELFAITPKIAALFQLRFCGVDLIRDSDTGELKVLEVNTAPQWSGEFGFQAVTGVNVAEEFADYAEHMLALSDVSSPLPRKIDAYYKSAIAPYRSVQFHYASRMWLWRQDVWSRDVLDHMRAWYIGETPEETRKILLDIVARKDKPRAVNQKRAYKRQYFERHQMLPIYNALLFKVIFSDSIYGYDIRPYVRELVSDREFLQLFNELLVDRDAVRVLSTHAINFFYLLKNYFKSLRLLSSVLIDPQELIEMAQDYSDLVDQGIIGKKDAIKLQIYMLTHAILGESKFYQRRVWPAGFGNICKMLEKIIGENYFEISLDNKLEFLVCADICRYKTRLRHMILAEAKRSVSWAGAFIVDKDAPLVRHAIHTAEHRNVLYIMASHKRFLRKKPNATKPARKPLAKQTLGRLTRVRVAELSNCRLIARVDTGATRSALCASDIHEENGVLHYKFLYPEHPLYTGEVVQTTNYSRTQLNSAGRKLDVRYTVRLMFTIGGDPSIPVECALVDRSHMVYPALLGRDMLRGKYRVDVSKQFLSH